MGVQNLQRIQQGLVRVRALRVVTIYEREYSMKIVPTIAMLSFTETPTRPIGHNEAIDFDRARNLTVAELRKDFDTLFARYNALIPEQCAMNTTRAAIAAEKVRSQGQAAPSSSGGH